MERGTPDWRARRRAGAITLGEGEGDGTMKPPYREGFTWVTEKHGKNVLDATIWGDDGQAVKLRIDLDAVVALLPQAEKNRRGMVKRGPLQIRRKRWGRGRLY